MGFKVAGYSFKGRYSIDETDQIEDWPGLYVILCQRGNGHYIIDVGESDNLKSALEENGRRDMWTRSCSGTLAVTVKYTLDLERLERVRMEKKIRNRHNPPCRKSHKLAS
jgi:hypothetical protein